MIQPAVFVPPIAIAHVFGIILLVYSLEKVSGVFSKLGRRIRSRRKRIARQTTAPPTKVTSPDAEANQNGHLQDIVEEGEHDDCASFISEGSDEDDAEGNHDWNSSADARQATSIVAESEPHVLTPAWIRGCQCIVRCSHRFSPRNKQYVTNKAFTSAAVGLLTASLLEVCHHACSLPQYACHHAKCSELERGLRILLL